MKNKRRYMYEDGVDEYPLIFVIGQNLFFVVYFTVGFIGMYSLQIANLPIISIGYDIFIAIMLIFVLMKHLCTHYYYYGKVCGAGWGKLAQCLFKKIGNYELGRKLAGLTWMLAMLFPINGKFLYVYKLHQNEHAYKIPYH